jgi:hypothetical protein
MQRSHLVPLIAAGAIALGTMMTLTAPSATAMPRSEIQGHCNQVGGSFWTDSAANGGGYICQYRLQSVQYRDLYNHAGEFGMTCEWNGRSYRNCTNY